MVCLRGSMELQGSPVGYKLQGLRLEPGPCTSHKWDFPKIRGTFFWGPYNKDPTI